MEIGKAFRDTSPMPQQAILHFVCMCKLALYTFYVSVMLRHRGGGGGGEGEDNLQLNSGTIRKGTYTLNV